MIPDMMPFLKMVFAWTRQSWLQELLQARQQLKNVILYCVRQRIEDKDGDRNDLLTCSVDPNTGVILTELDILTDAFAFM